MGNCKTCAAWECLGHSSPLDGKCHGNRLHVLGEDPGAGPVTVHVEMGAGTGLRDFIVSEHFGCPVHVEGVYRHPIGDNDVFMRVPCAECYAKKCKRRRVERKPEKVAADGNG